MDTGPDGASAREVSLSPRPERRLIRPGGSRRHIDFVVTTPRVVTRERPPLVLALVIDRSGSMSGNKLWTAKQAAVAVLDRLDERDRVAMVAFDDRIEVVLPAGPATGEAKRTMRDGLAKIQARGSTALHEGWLTGCNAIATDERRPTLARCFLLTDGLANVGLADPEQFASQAAGIREHAGICTSTFGIGDDYDERLLGPVAVAGGGQFHHLRQPEEVARTFQGELGNLFTVVAPRARLEIEADFGVELELVSQFWLEQVDRDPPRWRISLGDLVAGDERHVVARFRFPRQPLGIESVVVRARLVWESEAGQRHGVWEGVRFSYASNAACDAEPSDPTVMHWVGLHHADRARREALELNRLGDFGKAQALMRAVARRIGEYAGDDGELRRAEAELRELATGMAAPMPASAVRETYFQALRRSRGQRDLRS